MKLRLLFLFVLSIMSLHTMAQVPPPCGLSTKYVCDENSDGIATVNLDVMLPVVNCAGQVLTNYANVFFLTESDQVNNVNPIGNPESFTLVSPLTIFYIRSENLDTGFVELREDTIGLAIPPTPNTPTPFYSCDVDEDGITTFALYTKSSEILSAQGDAYFVSYHDTLQDAEALTNPLTDSDNLIYTNVIPFQQTIYASVYVYGNIADPSTVSCIEVVPLELIATQDCDDLGLELINPSTPPRPGFDHQNLLFFKNKEATTIASGTITFELDSYLNLNSVEASDTDLIITTTSNGFTIEFSDIEPDYEAEITINLNCPVSVPLGTVVVNTAFYNTNASDYDITNDNSSLSEIVVGSYDPNDIIEAHGPRVVYSEFSTSDQYFYYTIRFQNVGTAEAVTVRIEDVLDHQLDASSFQMIRASHNYSVLRTANHLEWNFENINLPAEQDDAEGSNGYVYFKIKPKPGYAVGDIIPNQASIFFDFNAPIVTNMFLSEFVDDPLSVIDLEALEFSLYPNPASHELNIKFKSSASRVITIYNVLGKQVLRLETLTDFNTIDVSTINSGVYFAEIKEGKTAVIKKVILD